MDADQVRCQAKLLWTTGLKNPLLFLTRFKMHKSSGTCRYSIGSTDGSLACVSPKLWNGKRGSNSFRQGNPKERREAISWGRIKAD
ncbi:uncharacterized protein VTP21DRAFT_5219 [Calcarisporiella thermophila]|uniref:uncharacterized protein n=1 Tax=Calcarisporiella thermophila TaxID=911321 RepID=UPI0037427890